MTKQRFTEADLNRMGMYENPEKPGEYIAIKRRQKGMSGINKSIVEHANKVAFEKMPYEPGVTKSMVKKYLQGMGANMFVDQTPGTTVKRKLVFSWAGKSVSLNQWYSSKHWSVRNKQAQEWHKLFSNFIINPKPFFPQYSIKMEHNSRLDNSNVIPMIKLAEDAIKKAGIITDDSTKYCKSIAIEFVEEMKRGSFKLTFIEI